MADVTRPWTVDENEATPPGMPAPVNPGTDSTPEDASAPDTSRTRGRAAAAKDRVSSAKTPPAVGGASTQQAALPPIAQLRETDDDTPSTAGNSPPTQGLPARAPTSKPHSTHTAQSSRDERLKHVLDAGEKLQKRAAALRRELNGVKLGVMDAFEEAFDDMSRLVEERVGALRPSFPEEQKATARIAVKDLRVATAEVARSARQQQKTTAKMFAKAQSELQRMSDGMSGPRQIDPAEREAIRELHGAIEELIREGGVGTELERQHQSLRNSQMSTAATDRAKFDSRPSSRVVGTRDAMNSAPLNDQSKGADSPRLRAAADGVDDTAMPDPADVVPAMFGNRSWKYHAPSLVGATPYAVNALHALRSSMKKNTTARDLLQLRIARQERAIEDANARADRAENVVRDHMESLNRSLARVSGGRLMKQPTKAGPSDVVAELNELTSTVEYFIDNLAHQTKRHVEAARRGQVVDVPPATLGVEPSDPKGAGPRATAHEMAKAALFPDGGRAARLQGEMALLRRRLVRERFLRALQTWRFRRCAMALVQRHTADSAAEATAEQEAAFFEASAALAASMGGSKQAEEDPAAASAPAEGGAPPSSDPVVAGSGDAELTVHAKGHRLEDSPEQAMPPVATQHGLAHPDAPFKTLSMEEASKRLVRAGVLPAAGADTLMEPGARKGDDDLFKFSRRAQQAQESWRARRAKAALERFRSATSGESQLEASKLLLEMDGGDDAKPNVFSALRRPVNPRYQNATQATASKARLRPIGHGPVVTPDSTSARGPCPPTSVRTSSSATRPVNTLASVPIADALGHFFENNNAGLRAPGIGTNRHGVHLA